MEISKYTSGEFVEKLKNEYGMDDVEKLTLRHYEGEGLFFPEKGENGYFLAP